MGNDWYEINSICGKGQVYEIRYCDIEELNTGKLNAPYVTRYIFEKEFFTFNDNTYTGTIIYDERSSSDEDEEDEELYIVVELEKDYISSSFDIIGPYEITERPVKIVNKNNMIMITASTFIYPIQSNVH